MGLLIIAAIIYAAFIVLKGGLDFYKSLTENTQVALAIALVSLAGTLFSIYYTKIKDRQLQIEASHTSKKQELYNKFIKDIIEVIAHPEKGDDEDFSLKSRKEFMSNSLLWAGPKVLQAYHKFRRSAQEDNPQSYIDMFSLFLAFREDLGLSNKNIDEQTILEILYNQEDIDNNMWAQS